MYVHVWKGKLDFRVIACMYMCWKLKTEFLSEKCFWVYLNDWIDWFDSEARLAMVVSKDGGRVLPAIPAEGA